MLSSCILMFIYCYLTAFHQQHLLLSYDQEVMNSDDVFLILFATISTVYDSYIILLNLIIFISSFMIELDQLVSNFIFIYFIINSDISIDVYFIINFIYMFTLL